MGSSKWSAQSAWYIDPTNGSDEDTGASGHPLKTRGEFYRRMGGATLAVSTAVTVAGSLASTDTYTAPIRTTHAAPLNWVGTPTALFTGTITSYTARSGSTNQATVMGISSIPTSWTASGLVDKVIEWTDGSSFIRAIVNADLGSKTAWITPPINGSNAQGQVFVTGTTVNVYSLPALNEVVHDTTFQTYSYLSSSRWSCVSGRLDCTNCSGPVNFFGGSFSPINCNTNPGPDDGSHNITGLAGGQVNIIGGKHSVIGSCSMRLSGHATFQTLRPEVGAKYETHVSSGAVAADIEFYNDNATTASLYFGAVNGGTIICNGYIYGTSLTVTDAVLFAGRDATLSCSHTPTITGAVNITNSLAGTSALVTALSSGHLTDVYNNRAIGPAGP